MPGTPSVKVSDVHDPVVDEFGQRWSPATINISWPPALGLEAPSIQIRVVAACRPDMSVDALRSAHIAAALGVLSQALLALEEPASTRSHVSQDR